MVNFPKNRLLVEGYEDKRVIPELIEANGIIWEPEPGKYIVNIEPHDGIDNLLDRDVIFTELNDSNLAALGLIVDADEEPIARWKSIRNVCLPSIADLPKSLPEEGLIHPTTIGPKFGVWMMPDNQMRGMLETFLAYMVPDQEEPLWKYACETVTEAKNLGAPFKKLHQDKAGIYTWLAWQNPPGRQLHHAVKERILDPQHPKAKAFVSWFKGLYDL
ncbi:MAG: hypothetical protein F6J93_21610 [Oscillatoria sp. SIO1A7]|nr:hypothetical protein [Oscillatoria sp. SIO1A7]